MSFILDALKKSEDERLGATGPNLAYAPTGRRRDGIPRWVLVLSALLLINLAVLVALMTWKQPTQEEIAQPAPRQLAESPMQMTPDPVPARPVARKPVSAPVPDAREQPVAATVRPLAQEARSENGGKMDPGLAEPPNIESEAATATATATATERSTPVVNEEQEEPSARVPSLNELLGEGKMMQLQSLSLDLHVYAARKEDRFVFINLSKYQEGQILKEGPRIEAITNDGVILQYQGERFLLPRS
ncbi:MAG: general secretion pathway protein GspB [Gammaproteobacteria bacterium]|jgi:hypothetical protein|nr:general secretion pathway protein GspB [Gammaproteobacteria bacterium]